MASSNRPKGRRRTAPAPRRRLYGLALVVAGAVACAWPWVGPMALFVGPLLAIVAGRLLKSPSGPSDEERYGRPEDVPDAPPGYSPFGWADWGGMVVDAAAIGLMLLAAGMLKGGWAGSRVEATIWVLAGLVLAGGLRLALFEGPSPV